MTTLSFSIDPMLPMIVQGLKDAEAEFHETFLPWFAGTFWPALSPEVEASARGRVKRQSIRAERPGAASPWARIKEGSTLHVKLKARHPTLGRPVATVKAISAHPITIENNGGDVFTDTSDLLRIGRSDIWHLDGFQTAEAFRDYFVPKPGDVFRGFLIRW